MNLNPTVPAWLTMVASAVSLFLASVPLGGLPPWAGVLIGAIGAAAAYIAHLQTSRADKAKLSAMSARLPMAVLALMLLCGSQACNQPVWPVVDKLVSVVVADLAAGDSDGKIASDVCSALGGTALTDAVCSDVTVIVADILQLILHESGVSAPVKARALEMGARLRAQGVHADSGRALRSVVWVPDPMPVGR